MMLDVLVNVLLEKKCLARMSHSCLEQGVVRIPLFKHKHHLLWKVSSDIHDTSQALYFSLYSAFWGLAWDYLTGFCGAVRDSPEMVIR